MGLSLALPAGKAPGPNSVGTCPAGTSESLLPTALLQNLRDLGSVSRPRSQLIFCCRILVNESHCGACWPGHPTIPVHLEKRSRVQTSLSPSASPNWQSHEPPGDSDRGQWGRKKSRERGFPLADILFLAL